MDLERGESFTQMEKGVLTGKSDEKEGGDKDELGYTERNPDKANQLHVYQMMIPMIQLKKRERTR